MFVISLFILKRTCPRCSSRQRSYGLSRSSRILTIPYLPFILYIFLPPFLYNYSLHIFISSFLRFFSMRSPIILLIFINIYVVLAFCWWVSFYSPIQPSFLYIIFYFIYGPYLSSLQLQTVYTYHFFTFPLVATYFCMLTFLLGPITSLTYLITSSFFFPIVTCYLYLYMIIYYLSIHITSITYCTSMNVSLLGFRFTSRFFCDALLFT